VASLGWVLPERQLRVSPPFFSWKTDDLFSHHRLPVLRCHSYLFSREKMTTFFLITVTFLDFTRVSPPGGCHRTPVLPVQPRLFTILCKFARKKIPLGVISWRVSPGRSVSPSHPLVSPLTDRDKIRLKLLSQPRTWWIVINILSLSVVCKPLSWVATRPPCICVTGWSA